MFLPSSILPLYADILYFWTITSLHQDLSFPVIYPAHFSWADVPGTLGPKFSWATTKE